MDVSKCTPGPAQAVHDNSGIYFYGWNEYWIVDSEEDGYIGYTHRGEDAELYAEATTVAHETGLSPRQLAEQREELLAFASIVDATFGSMPDGSLGQTEDSLLRKARAALAACK